MPNLTPLSREAHANTRWRRYSDYRFAQADAVAPLVIAEVPRAALALPLAFVPSAEGANTQPTAFQLVALQGLQPGRNLWVAPDGRWLAAYVPACYRSYPFALARTAEDQRVLCIDADSGLLGAEQGEPLFDSQGQPTEAVKGVLQFLQQIDAARPITAQATAVLQAHGLIQPWPIVLKSEQGDRPVQGLYRVDEAALLKLPAEALAAVRDAGGLTLAYAQLLSSQHVQTLVKLAELHAQHAAGAGGVQGAGLAGMPGAGGLAAAGGGLAGAGAGAGGATGGLPQTANGELDLEFLNQNGTLKLGGLL